MSASWPCKSFLLSLIFNEELNIHLWTKVLLAPSAKGPGRFLAPLSIQKINKTLVRAVHPGDSASLHHHHLCSWGKTCRVQTWIDNHRREIIYRSPGCLWRHSSMALEWYRYKWMQRRGRDSAQATPLPKMTLCGVSCQAMAMVTSPLKEVENDEWVPGYHSSVYHGWRNPFLYTSTLISEAGPPCLEGGRRKGRKRLEYYRALKVLSSYCLLKEFCPQTSVSTPIRDLPSRPLGTPKAPSAKLIPPTLCSWLLSVAVRAGLRKMDQGIWAREKPPPGAIALLSRKEKRFPAASLVSSKNKRKHKVMNSATRGSKKSGTGLSLVN